MASDARQRLLEACEALSDTYGVQTPRPEQTVELLAFLAEAPVAVVHELPRVARQLGSEAGAGLDLIHFTVRPPSL